MKFFNNFFSKNTLKNKIVHIQNDIKNIVTNYCDEKIWIMRYGAYDIDPKYLVIWVCVVSDCMKHKLQSNNELKKSIDLIFKKHGYPEQAMSKVKVGFESQETVDRESEGDWYLHFK